MTSVTARASFRNCLLSTGAISWEKIRSLGGCPRVVEVNAFGKEVVSRELYLGAIALGPRKGLPQSLLIPIDPKVGWASPELPAG